MFTAFYTLVRVEDGYSAVTEPYHTGKVKSYTKPQFARSARSQTATPWLYRILETVVYPDGGTSTRWID